MARESLQDFGNGRSTLRSATRFCAESLFNLLFPADCRLCGDPLSNASRLPVCSACLNDLSGFTTPQCIVCGEALFSQHVGILAEPVCGLCQRARPAYMRAVASGPYDGRLRELIHLLKYGRVRVAARPLGIRLAGQVIALRELVGDHALLQPVPLYRSKFYQRGFNQSEEIALELQRALASLGWTLRLSRTTLKRVRPTTSQTGLTRHQRRANVRGAFAVGRPEDIAGRNVILVDDVLTTGTTAQECARVLRRAGAKAVWVATAARVSKLSLGNSLRQQEVALGAFGSAARA